MYCRGIALMQKWYHIIIYMWLLYLETEKEQIFQNPRITSAQYVNYL